MLIPQAFQSTQYVDSQLWICFLLPLQQNVRLAALLQLPLLLFLSMYLFVWQLCRWVMTSCPCLFFVIPLNRCAPLHSVSALVLLASEERVFFAILWLYGAITSSSMESRPVSSQAWRLPALFIYGSFNPIMSKIQQMMRSHRRTHTPTHIRNRKAAGYKCYRHWCHC